MLTPRFSLSQTDTHLTVKIFATMARISDTEIHIEDNNFIFYSSPYYLRLNLPGKLVDSEKETHKATFDSDQCAFVVVCEKQNAGELFSGLDMLTHLLTPKGNNDINKPLIEVIDKGGTSEDTEEELENLDWFYEQELPEHITLGGHKYGFNNAYNNVFNELQSEICGVIDVSEPDLKSPSQRREERLAQERNLFNEDHYLADLYEKDDVTFYDFRPHFYDLTPEAVQPFSEAEQEILLNLPRKELLLDPSYRRCAYLQIVDIILAWCYNHRISGGEECSEAAWNIAKLSSTLSWLDSFRSIRDVVISFSRRSLVFPLVRNWKLSSQVVWDAARVIGLGKKQVLKSLLQVHSTFNSYEPYYILNRLYIDDLCIWIQTLPDEKLFSLADSLNKVSLSKADVNLEIAELESAAQMVYEEAQNQTNLNINESHLVDSMNRLTVIENAYAIAQDDNRISQERIPPLIESLRCHQNISDSDDDSTSESDSSDDESSLDDSSSDSSSTSDSCDSDYQLG